MANYRVRQRKDGAWCIYTAEFACTLAVFHASTPLVDVEAIKQLIEHSDLEQVVRQLANIPIKGSGLSDDYANDQDIVKENNTQIIDLIKEAREILDVT